MGKRVKFIVLIAMAMALLVGCMPEELRNEIKQKEREAKACMEDFLEDEFEDYKIVEYGLITSGNVIEGWDISSITIFEVKIDGHEYCFAYDLDDDSYWSNYYYDEIVDDLEDELSEYGILEYADSCEVNVGKHISNPNVNLLLHEDEDVEDVIDRIQDGEDEYFTECYFYFSNERDFNPEDVALEYIYEDFSNMHIVLYNTDGDGKDLINITDTLDYKDSTYDENEIYVKYSHSKFVYVDGMYFSYDDNYYDIEISSIDYDENDPERTTFVGTEFKRWGPAYSIEVEQITETDNTEEKYDYVSEEGFTVNVTYSNFHRLEMYFTQGKYEDKYLYDSYSQRMEDIYIYSNKSYSTDHIWLKDMDGFSIILAMYEERN